VAECERALAGTPTPRVRAALLLERAQAYDRLGRAADALADAEAADRLVPQTEVGLRVRVLRILGGMYIDHDRLDEAEATLIEGSQLATTGGVTWELVGCNVNLSFVRQQRGDLAAAIELDRQSVRELHRIRHSFEGGALANLSHKLIDAGQLVEAAAVADRAATTAMDAGDLWAVADARYAVGRAAGRLGQRSTAVTALRASLDLLRELGTTSMLDDVERELDRWSAVELRGADDGDVAAGEHHVG